MGRETPVVVLNSKVVGEQKIDERKVETGIICKIRKGIII